MQGRAWQGRQAMAACDIFIGMEQNRETLTFWIGTCWAK